jgi:hypothetical protein
MKLPGFTAFLGVVLFSLAPTAHARTPKADVSFGYSRVGGNLYAPYTPGMNGWQLAMHIKPTPFVGVEGEISRYSQNITGFSQQVTLVMGGPRVTVHAAGFSVFAHALGGIAHQNATVTIYPAVSSDATSYALGAGVDVPLFLGFKLRGTGDYLGNSNAPSSSYSPAHYRVGVGLAYHF